MSNSKINTQLLIKELEEALQTSKELLKATEITNALYIEMAKSIKDSFDVVDSKTTKELTKFNKALDTTNDLLEKQEENLQKKKKTEQEISKLEKQIIAQKEKLNDALKEESLELQKLRIQTAEQNKIRKQEARLALGLVGAYEKQSKKLRELKKRYKDLAAEGKENTKVAKKLKREITKLDDRLVKLDESVNDNTRSIGKYKKAMEGLNKTAKAAGLMMILSKAVELLGQAFGDSREGALKMEKAMAAMAATAKVVFTNVSIWIGGAVDWTSAKFDIFSIKFNNFTNELKNGLSKLKNFSLFGNSKKDVEDLKDGLKDVDKDIETVEGLIDRLKERLTSGTMLPDKKSGLEGELKAYEKKLKDIYARRQVIKDKIDEKEKQKTGETELLPMESTAEAEDRVKEANKVMDSVSFSGIWEQSTRAANAMMKLAEMTTEYNIANKELQLEIANLTTVQRTQLQIAENDKLSFKTRLEASEKAIAAAKQLVKKEKILHETQLNLTRDLVAEKVKQAGIEIDVSKMTAVQLMQVLNDKKNGLKASEADHQALLDALITINNAEMEANLLLLDTTEKNLMLRSDQAEVKLDIEESAMASLTELNKKQIANEKQTNEDRRKLMQDNIDMFEEGYDRQFKDIVKQGKRINEEETRILEDRRKSVKDSLVLTDKEKKKRLDAIDAQLEDIRLQSEQMTQEDLLRIAKMDNIELQKQELLNLGLGEKFILRYLKAIENYRKGKQDLNDTQEDLNNSMAEEADLQAEIERQVTFITTADTDAARKKMDEDEFQYELKKAKERVDIAKDGSIEKLKAQVAYNDLLIEEQERYYKKTQEQAEEDAEKKKKLDEEAQARREELITNSLETLDALTQRYSEKRIDSIEREQDANQKRIDQITAAIEAGNEGAKASLAEEEKRSAELEQKKERERKRAMRLEAGVAILRAFGENEGDLGKTITDTTALLAFINSVSSFYDGTEDTGTVANPLDSNGGRVAVLHDNERVMTAKQNAKVGSMSNEDLADLAYMHNNGTLSGGATVVQQNNSELSGKLDRVVSAIENIPVSSYNYDAKGKYHEQVLETRNKKEIIKTRANDIYR